MSNIIKRYDIILENGNECLHKEDGPAIEWDDGSFAWYSFGIIT